MGQVERRLRRRPAPMPVALLGAVLFLGGCVCCGPRHYGESGREVGYQPMGQQRPSANYATELERRLAGWGRNR